MTRSSGRVGRRSLAPHRSTGHRAARGRLWMRLVVLLSLALATPNLMELVEDVAHYVADGHTPHDSGHEHEHGDHCCTGLFHVCLCHAPALATPVVPPAAPRPPGGAVMVVTCPERGGPLSGVRSPPYRPPRV